MCQNCLSYFCIFLLETCFPFLQCGKQQKRLATLQLPFASLSPWPGKVIFFMLQEHHHGSEDLKTHFKYNNPPVPL